MNSHGEEPKIVTLSAGAAGGWLGPSDAKKVLLYFHGKLQFWRIHIHKQVGWYVEAKLRFKKMTKTQVVDSSIQHTRTT